MQLLLLLWQHAAVAVASCRNEVFSLIDLEALSLMLLLIVVARRSRHWQDLLLVILSPLVPFLGLLLIPVLPFLSAVAGLPLIADSVTDSVAVSFLSLLLIIGLEFILINFHISKAVSFFPC